MSLFQRVQKSLVSHQTEQMQLAQEQAKTAYMTDVFKEKSMGVANTVSTTKYFIAGFILLAIGGWVYMETRKN